MAAPVRRFPDQEFPDAVVERAAAAGFQLVHYETPQGQLLWEWRCGDEPRPQFVSRRVALDFMEDWLSRSTATRRHSRIRRRARRKGVTAQSAEPPPR